MTTFRNTRYGSTRDNLMTAEELIRLPKGQFRYELLKGRLLTISPSGATHGAVTIRLSGHLFNHVQANKLGILFGAETGFKLQRNPDTVLAPDIAFIARERVESLPDGYLDLVPDLVVEVISPSERAAKVAKKTALWLSFGVHVVWLVRPRAQTIEVHRIDDVKTLTRLDLLVDKQILHGFQVRVADIFS